MRWCNASQSLTRIDLNSSSSSFTVGRGVKNLRTLSSPPDRRTAGMRMMGVLAPDCRCARVRVARRAVRNKRPGCAIVTSLCASGPIGTSRTGILARTTWFTAPREGSRGENIAPDADQFLCQA
jgi:hypothetical protein